MVNTDFPPLSDALEQLELEPGELTEREKFLDACPARLDPRQDFDRIQSYFRKKGITPE